MISLYTSADDLRSSFKYSIRLIEAGEFEEAIKEEEAGQNRITVIKLLKRALRMKKMGAWHI